VTIDVETVTVPNPEVEADPATVSAHLLEDAMDIEADPRMDIKDIIMKCLKQANKIRVQGNRSLKILMQLTAVMKYVQERARYQAARRRCKTPCLTTSLVVARCMGKGAYFARQIC
jgi:hypothetical protein